MGGLSHVTMKLTNWILMVDSFVPRCEQDLVWLQITVDSINAHTNYGGQPKGVESDYMLMGFPIIICIDCLISD